MGVPAGCVGSLAGWDWRSEAERTLIFEAEGRPKPDGESAPGAGRVVPILEARHEPKCGLGEAWGACRTGQLVENSNPIHSTGRANQIKKANRKCHDGSPQRGAKRRGFDAGQRGKAWRIKNGSLGTKSFANLSRPNRARCQRKASRQWASKTDDGWPVLA